MRKLRAGVIGLGYIGASHIESIRRLGFAELAGVADVNYAFAAKKADALGIEHVYQDVDALLADPGVDIVHNCTPNNLHAELNERILKAGKHLLSEKPLARTSEETGRLVKLSQGLDLAAGVNFNYRMNPMVQDLRGRVKRGELGDITLVHGCYLQDWLLYDTDYNWRVLAEQGGELRAVSDIGTHWMDLVLSITGLEVDSVFADLNTVHKVRKRPTGEVETFTGKQAAPVATEPINITTDDYGCILFRFKNGARGSLNVSQINAGRKNTLRYEIAGSKCSVAFSSETPNELWIGYRNKPNECFARDPSLLADLPRGFTNYPGGHNEGFPDAFKQCFRSFYQSIAAGDFSAKPLFPTFAEGHREVILCEAILESHRQEKWVKL